jgi:hypothetical protein
LFFFLLFCVLLSSSWGLQSNQSRMHELVDLLKKVLARAPKGHHPPAQGCEATLGIPGPNISTL